MLHWSFGRRNTSPLDARPGYCYAFPGNKQNNCLCVFVGCMKKKCLKNSLSVHLFFSLMCSTVGAADLRTSQFRQPFFFFFVCKTQISKPQTEKYSGLVHTGRRNTFARKSWLDMLCGNSNGQQLVPFFFCMQHLRASSRPVWMGPKITALWKHHLFKAFSVHKGQMSSGCVLSRVKFSVG